MKRGLLIIIFMLCFFGLVGCQSSKVSYKDPETGEEREIKIEKTSDKEEVVDSIYALLLSDREIKDDSKLTLDLDFSVELKDEENIIKITGNCFSSINTNKEKIIDDLSDKEKEQLVEGYYKITFKGSNTKDDKEVKYSRSTIEEFVEDGKSYLKFDIDEKFIDLLEEIFPPLWFELDQIKDKIIVLDGNLLLNSLIPSSSIVDIIDVNTMSEVLEKYAKASGDSIDYASLRAETEAIVKKLGVEIVNVSGADVSYKFAIGELLKEEYGQYFNNSLCEVVLTLNVADISLVDLKVDFATKDKNEETKVSIQCDVSYKARITKISDKDKENAEDGMEYLKDFVKKYAQYIYNQK